MATDAQAALAAAALIVANNGYAPSPLSAEQITLNMAYGFLRWLQTHERPYRPEPDDDVRERNQRAVRAFHRRSVNINLCVCGRQWPCEHRTLHDLSPTATTPSGARACLCGEKWPCSQSQWQEEPS